VCTVLLKFTPGARWPLLLAAVRDEFADRAWDGPARHWTGAAASLIGGRDRQAGGTWLALAPEEPAMAALLNGIPLQGNPGVARPSRGGLPLAALSSPSLPDFTGYDTFHLLHAGLGQAEVWSWDGVSTKHQKLDPGCHILVNLGVDAGDDPLVPHFQPLLEAVADPDPRPGLAPDEAWGGWVRLLAGDGLDPEDERALIVRREYDRRIYASTSASLLALAPDAVRYDFTATPGPGAVWSEVSG
jgi:hypothetical protein